MLRYAQHKATRHALAEEERQAHAALEVINRQTILESREQVRAPFALVSADIFMDTSAHRVHDMRGHAGQQSAPLRFILSGGCLAKSSDTEPFSTELTH